MQKPRYRILIIPNTINVEAYFANKWFFRDNKKISDWMRMEPFWKDSFIIWTQI